MSDKHTPGPWYAESGHKQQNGQVYWQITDGNDAIMQNQFCWCQGSHEANARLIAAAPDLLEALEAALNEADGVKITAWEDAARAAIAKARGADFAPRSDDVGQNDA